MLQLLVNGLVLGSIIALAAIGLSVIYGILNFANFAHGDFLALGA
jgi:branched-subunit amino acid ABC-type transport system permease component